MKIRIRGNSIRLRLTRPEVANFARTGRAVERTAFAPGQALAYALRASDDATIVAARFADGIVTVLVPRGRALAWANGDDVAIEGAQAAGEGEQLAILIEKDFQCLHGEGEPDPEAFAHPAAAMTA